MKPDVKQYLNALLFLQDYYEYRKQADAEFSYQKWAYELGFNSKSYLRFAVFGQRKISEELTQQFCRGLKLDELDQEYFSLLILYSQSKEAEQKRIYGRKLTQLLKLNISMDEVTPADEVMADPLNLVVRHLLSFSDIKRTPEILSAILAVSVEKIEACLLRLQSENLVEQHEEQWRAVHDTIKVKNQPGHAGILSFHKQSLLKAIQAQATPAQERSYRSVTLALSPAEFAEYQNDVNQFVQQTFLKYDGNQLKSKRIYQINLNSIPWTNTVEEGVEIV